MRLKHLLACVYFNGHRPQSIFFLWKCSLGDRTLAWRLSSQNVHGNVHAPRPSIIIEFEQLMTRTSQDCRSGVVIQLLRFNYSKTFPAQPRARGDTIELAGPPQHQQLYEECPLRGQSWVNIDWDSWT